MGVGLFGAEQEKAQERKGLGTQEQPRCEGPGVS